MSSLGYVYEFADWPTQDNLTIAKWTSRTVLQPAIDFTSAAAQSAAFGVNTRYILFTANTRFAWTIGSNPTATTGMMPFAADQPYHILVQPGDKISFVASP